MGINSYNNYNRHMITRAESYSGASSSNSSLTGDNKNEIVKPLNRLSTYSESSYFEYLNSLRKYETVSSPNNITDVYDLSLEYIDLTLKQNNEQIEQYKNEIGKEDYYEYMVDDKIFSNYFPSCLYMTQNSYGAPIFTEDEYEYVLKVMHVLGIESNLDLPYNEYLENVKKGKYLDYMLDYMGYPSAEGISFINIMKILGCYYKNYSNDTGAKCYTIDTWKLELLQLFLVSRDEFVGYKSEFLYNFVEEYMYGLTSYNIKFIYDERLSNAFLSNGKVYAPDEKFKDKDFLAACVLLYGDPNTDNYFHDYNDIFEKYLEELSNSGLEGASDLVIKNHFKELAYNKILNIYFDYDNCKEEITLALSKYLKFPNSEDDYDIYIEDISNIINRNCTSSNYGSKIFDLYHSILLPENYDSFYNNDINSEFSSYMQHEFEKIYDPSKEVEARKIQGQYNEEITNLKLQNQQLEVMKVDIKCSRMIDLDDFDKYSKPVVQNYLGLYYFDYMTQEEKDKFYYLYNTGKIYYFEDGTYKDAYVVYCESKKNEWNQRIGLENAWNWVQEYLVLKKEYKNIDEMTVEELEKLKEQGILSDSFFAQCSNFLTTVDRGLGDGICSFFEGIGNCLFADGVVSAAEYERMFIAEILNSSSEFLGGTYNVSSSIGNMLPSIMVSAYFSILTCNPEIGVQIGQLFMGWSSAGNSREAALQSGASEVEAMLYGILNGSSEMLLGYYLGRIPFLSKYKMFTGGKFPNPLISKNLMNFVFDVGMEGLEESVQSVISQSLDMLILDESGGFDWGEVFQSGLYGVITAGIMNGGEVIIPKVGSKLYMTYENAEILVTAYKAGLIDESRIAEPGYLMDIIETENARRTGAEVQKENSSSLESYETKQKIENETGAVVQEESSSNDDNAKRVKDNIVNKYGEEHYNEWEEAYTNPDYYDLEKSSEKWPESEGSAEYSHLSDAEFLTIANNEGIKGLKELGAEEITSTQLVELSEITRATSKSDCVNDKYGEYFGGSSVSGSNDISHRVLGPSTTSAVLNGEGSIYIMKITGVIDDVITITDAVGYESGLTIGEGTEYNVVCMKTHTADWFGQTGGAEQYVFYVTDSDGKILTKKNYDGTLSAYKLTRDQLIDLGMITDMEILDINNVESLNPEVIVEDFGNLESDIKNIDFNNLSLDKSD